MTSTLELLRQRHEDIETLKQLGATALQSRSDPSNPHPRLNSLPNPLRTVRDAEQLSTDLVSTARTHASFLHDFYISGQPICEEHPEPTSEFYAALRQLRDVHRTPMVDSADLSLSSSERDAAILASFQPAQFSGEEGSGRFLDLQSFFHQYVNLTKDQSLHYHQFVRDKLTKFDHIPSATRCARHYEKYLNDLVSYLTNFARRAHPLDNTDQHIKKESEQIRQSLQSELEQLSNTHNSADELTTAFGEDGVKSKLLALALKTGGRPADRAVRLWSAAEKGTFGRAALLQKQVTFLVDRLLEEEKTSTVANIQKKLSLSYEEIEAERKAEEANMGGIDEEEDTQQVESTMYNPKDVPLGWDGKPIPYWMYKLHGLNHEFKCEICGGATYKGPRLFERHFTDPVHVGGLKRLGISYTKAFLMITRIQDAIQLHERLASRQKDTQFDTEREVEVEDDNGNVMNLKTFQDLKRQGIL